MRTPILRWLSLRLRILLGAVLVVGALLPPYVPASALSGDPEELELPSQQFLFVEDGFLMKASSIGEQGTRLAFSEGLVHRVGPGDTITKIAQRYGISVQTIQWANGIAPGTSVKQGQDLLVLPVDGVVHIVRPGQTLSRIAQLYDIPQDEIARQNKVKGGFIVAGEQLIIPGGKPIVNSPTVVAAADGTLQFAERLPDKQIQLRLNLPDDAPGTPAKPRAPLASAVISQTVLQSPCSDSCFLTQGYHPGHYAVDMQVRGGGPIYAAEAGTVIRADTGYNGGYGNIIEIEHGNGLVTLYAHNKEMYVEKGDTVARGQTIAFMGNTGRVHGPTGIHTHFEVRVNGVKKNPLLYLE